MTEINRKSHPELHKISKLNLHKPSKNKLNNGLPIFILDSGNHDVVRIDFIFSAGNWYQDKPLISRITNTMLNEGTKNYTAFEIAEKLEYYGAYIQLNNFYDFSDIVVYCLKKYLPDIIKIIEDIIKNPVFPEKELQTYIKKAKQNHIISKSKVQNLAREKFLQVLFGQNHPYGQIVETTDFDNINTGQLISYFTRLYHSQNCKILLSGKIDDEVVNLINNCFGGNDWCQNLNTVQIEHKIQPLNQKQTIIIKDEAVQSAIRIGKQLYNYSHLDYFGMSILNKILGGYFGSRLMTNIREDKGYTYGIGSILVSLKNTGYFVVASEVGVEVCKNAVKEIYYEIEKLKNEYVSIDELNLVKNYILGQMLRSFDGPFNLADSYRTIIENDLEFDFYDKFINVINTIEPVDLINLANKYFDTENFYEVIAGKY